MPVGLNVSLTGDWKKTRVFGKAPKVIDDALQTVLMQEAEFMKRQMNLGIRKQAPGDIPFTPLAPRTIAERRRKGIKGDLALIARGDLLKSIIAKKIRHGAFAGILRGSKNREGKSLVAIGKIQEYGSPSRNIPARPFIMPVYQKHLRNARNRFAARLRKILGSTRGLNIKISAA